MSDALRRVLVIEQGSANCEALEELCAHRAIALDQATDATAAIGSLRARAFELILCDVTPLQLNGVQVCRELRGVGVTTPVIVLSPLRDPIDAVVALELGADDFVRKPYQPRELIARMEAQLRRQQRSDRDLVAGDLRISTTRRMVWRNDVEITLTRTEFDLLVALVRRPERPVSRQELIRDTAMHGDAECRTVDAHIHRLRRKIEPRNGRPILIQSVTGHGYRFAGDRANLAGAA